MRPTEIERQVVGAGLSVKGGGQCEAPCRLQGLKPYILLLPYGGVKTPPFPCFSSEGFCWMAGTFYPEVLRFAGDAERAGRMPALQKARRGAQLMQRKSRQDAGATEG